MIHHQVPECTAPAHTGNAVVLVAVFFAQEQIPTPLIPHPPIVVWTSLDVGIRTRGVIELLGPGCPVAIVPLERRLAL